MKRIAVFASGNGSNFEAIVNASKQKDSPFKVVLLVTDQLDAYCLTRAEENNINTLAKSPKHYPDKIAYEADLLAYLIRERVEFIALAGYMRLIGPTLLEAFEGKMVNIHPSLLPQFPGLNAVGQALEAGAAETGVTVHYVDSGMDTGPIIAQESIPITSEDTYETIQKKVQEIEHQLYPKTIKQLIRKGETIAETCLN